ncbi:hypothetical protein OIDMADRAFT_139197, partial [Oidiodendron maius Zn]
MTTSLPPLPRPASTYEKPSPILHRPAVRPRPVSDLPLRTTEPVIRSQKQYSETMIENDISVASSAANEVSSARVEPRRGLRTSTTFQLAHPAPTLTQKQRLIHIRPRLLLQLQRLSPGSRPEPTIDVLPSAVAFPRLVRKLPRMLRGKAVLGMNDVLLVRSEEYDRPDNATMGSADSGEESLSNREILAVICQMPKDAGSPQGKTEIVLRDGSVWVAMPLPNGLYEFVTVDENGNRTIARWVKRSTRR